MPTVTVGVLALQGGFHEHLDLLRKAAAQRASSASTPNTDFIFTEVRDEEQLGRCDALVIPGGESTAISLVATQSGLMEPLRAFVKSKRRPVWGTCAGAILLADEVNATKKGGQELIGGLGVRVHRNHFGRQIESFVADLDLPFLSSGSGSGDEDASSSSSSSKPAATAPFPGVFIRAPVVEEILSADSTKPPPPSSSSVEVLAVLPGRKGRANGVSQSAADDSVGDIVAVRQGNIFATSFHPELTDDVRIHAWWLDQVLRALGSTSST